MKLCVSNQPVYKQVIFEEHKKNKRPSYVKYNLVLSNFLKISRRSSTKFAEENDANKHQKGYNSWTHLVSMLFCQFAKRQSVRDISNGLGSATGNLNLSNLVAIIRLKLFVKIDLQLWLDNPFEEIDTSKTEKYLQGVLF